MKLKIFTMLAIAGMAIVGCGSNKSDEHAMDSNTTDTTMATPSTANDTAM